MLQRHRPELHVDERDGALVARCRVTLPPGARVEGIGLRLRRSAPPRRLLVDGYHGWDWAGVRDASAMSSGWWGAVWADSDAAPGSRLAIRLAGAPVVGALAIRSGAGGAIDALTVGEPVQEAQRTGAASPLTVPASGVLWSDPVLLTPCPPPGPAAGLPSLPGGRRPGPRRSGWMSWNCLGPAVTAAEALRIGLELVPRGGTVLVDDGWMPCWGDWYEHDGFGRLHELGTALRSAGRDLGIWLAPFLVDPASTLATAHPDWLLLDASGDPVVDLRPALPHLVLDPTVAAAAGWLGALAGRLAHAGVRMVKLDFLYAGALPGRRAEPGVSGVAALRGGVEAFATAFRAAAGPDATVLACGAPGPCVTGIVDASRSGGDAVVNVPNRGAAPPAGPRFAHGAAIVRAQTRNLAARAVLWGAELPPDVDAVTLGAVGDTVPVDDEVLEHWLALARRAGGPLLVADTPEGLGPARRAMLDDLLAHGPGSAVPAVPIDPVGMTPTLAEDDDFLAWPDDLPDLWAPGRVRG